MTVLCLILSVFLMMWIRYRQERGNVVELPISAQLNAQADNPTAETPPKIANVEQFNIPVKPRIQLDDSNQRVYVWWLALPFGVKCGIWSTIGACCWIAEAPSTFFLLFGFFMLYIFTREDNARNRKRGEKSAYSVFNRNCEKIDGTFNPDDFDKQLRKGGLGFS